MLVDAVQAFRNADISGSLLRLEEVDAFLSSKLGTLLSGKRAFSGPRRGRPGTKRFSQHRAGDIWSSGLPVAFRARGIGGGNPEPKHLMGSDAD